MVTLKYGEDRQEIINLNETNHRMFEGNDNPLAKGITVIKYLAIVGVITLLGLVVSGVYLLVTWLV